MTRTPDGRTLRHEGRRDEILAAVTEHALDHGLAGLTLRAAAQAVGVSHATLVHHFATKDALVTEIVESVLTRGLSLDPPSAPDGRSWAESLWDHLTSSDGRRVSRLFVSLVGLSLYGEPAYKTALERSMRQRVDALSAGLVAAGCPATEATGVATAFVARIRGLMIDLLVTGDEDRLAAAVRVVVEDGAARAARWRAAARG